MFRSREQQTKKNTQPKRRRYDFCFSFNFIVQLIAVRLCRVKPLRCCIKMNFIASIKGHNDVARSTKNLIQNSAFLCDEPNNIKCTAADHLRKKSTQPIKSCILRCSLRKKRNQQNFGDLVRIGGFTLLLCDVIFLVPSVKDASCIFFLLLSDIFFDVCERVGITKCDFCGWVTA